MIQGYPEGMTVRQAALAALFNPDFDDPEAMQIIMGSTLPDETAEWSYVGNAVGILGELDPQDSKVELFTCYNCFFQSKSMDSFQKHSKGCTADGKRFLCNESDCEYRTDRLYNLKVHQKKHQHPENICDKCSKVYKHKKDLKAHQSKAHSTSNASRNHVKLV